MQQTPEKILYRWLGLLKIPVARKFLRQQVLSHPEYPSLLSITDTLNELGINHAAILVQKDQWHEVPVPFVAHIHNNEGGFVIITKHSDAERLVPDFFSKWTGIVVAIEKTAIARLHDNEKHLESERSERNRRTAFLIFAALLAIAAIVQVFSFMAAAILLLATAGVFTAILILAEELGIENKIAEQVCGKNADCSAVIHSPKAKLPFELSWGDIGLTWFTAQFLQIVFASFAGTFNAALVILSLLATAAIPFIIFSVYYQWRVIKKWCRICLMTVGVLLAEFLLLIAFWQPGAWQLIEPGAILFAVSTMLLAGISWILVKPLLVRNKKMLNAGYSLLRFKRSTQVFIPMLMEQRRIDTTPFYHDLQLANADAPVQMIVACNPYCEPCARAHEVLHRIVDQYGEEAGVTIRFALNQKNEKQPEAVAHILAIIKRESYSNTAAEQKMLARLLLYDWFGWMDLEKFKTKYPLHPFADIIEITSWLSDHELWSHKNGVTTTPTLFINGYEFPPGYDFKDLPFLMQGIIEKLAAEKIFNALLQQKVEEPGT